MVAHEVHTDEALKRLHPMASVLDITVEHLLGCDVDLSMSQVSCLTYIYTSSLKSLTLLL